MCLLCLENQTTQSFYLRRKKTNTKKGLKNKSLFFFITGCLSII